MERRPAAATEVNPLRWQAAATLTERVQPGEPASPDAVCPADRIRAERRLQHWLEQPAFGGDQTRLEERLAQQGMDWATFQALLAEPDLALRERLVRAGARPDWPSRLLSVYRAEPVGAIEVDTLFTDPATRLIYLVEPLVDHAVAELRTELEALTVAKDLVDVASVLAGAARQLCGLLLPRIARTLLLELGAARVEGALVGASPADRFHTFVTGLRDRRTALELLAGYPVLARELVERADRWRRASTQLLHRLGADWPLLRRTLLTDGDPGPLVDLGLGAGDPHRGGQSVALPRFATGRRLVYKPRSLAVDAGFQRLLGWLNERGAQPAYRTVTVLDQGDYGWMEYVAAKPCERAEQVGAFFRRQGGYLALLHCLHAVDLHCENLVAAGEHPVLVDLETLFHPVAPVTASSRKTADQDPAQVALAESVLLTGMLPLDGGDHQVSGLGATGDGLSAEPVAAVADSATDQMRMVRSRLPVLEGENRVRLAGVPAEPADHVDDLVAGFETVCGLLRQHRTELLAADGPLAPFAGASVRRVLRPTQAYASMLVETGHPDLLRDALASDRFLDNLWTSSQGSRLWNTVFGCERHDLSRGDVPLFTATPDRTDLFCADGHRHPGLFDRPALAMVRDRIAALDPGAVRRQVHIIRAALTAHVLGRRAPAWPVTRLPETPESASRPRLLAAAGQLGDRLGELAVGRGERVGWLGLFPSEDRSWSLRPVGPDLYGGLAGLALFLAYLGQVSGEERHTRLAERALAGLRQQTVSGTSWLAEADRPYLSVFEHAPGGIYTLAHLGVVWDRPELVTEAQRLALCLAPAIDRAEAFDIITGTAGFTCLLLGLHRARPHPELLAMAVASGDRLLATAIPAGGGLAWNDVGGGPRPLAGFSHGAAGAAYALLRLYQVSGHQRFAASAEQALAYERSCFDAEEGNWPDLRASKRSFMTAWCHGAPGIGLTRALAVELGIGGERVVAELRSAVRATLADGLEQNHSLCHGTLGNLELLLAAASALGDVELTAQASRIAGALLTAATSGDWRCGLPGGAQTPGLMTGLAGIGFGLLRLAEPDRVPSVLGLAGPVLPGG